MLKVSIVGASGYTGGDLLRILLFHPEVEIQQATSERHAGKLVSTLHPNLRKICKLKFVPIDELEPCDVLFLGLPHGHMMNRLAEFEALADTLIDLSADFRIHDPEAFETWYGKPHSCPERMADFVYGIPELHRAEIKGAKRISGAGCNATATLLALHPLYQAGLVESSVVEVKAGSSQGGNAVSEGSHHPERSGAVRSYKPTAHRHLGEIRQELKADNIHFSATSIEILPSVKSAMRSAECTIYSIAPPTQASPRRTPATRPRTSSPLKPGFSPTPVSSWATWAVSDTASVRPSPSRLPTCRETTLCWSRAWY